MQVGDGMIAYWMMLARARSLWIFQTWLVAHRGSPQATSERADLVIQDIRKVIRFKRSCVAHPNCGHKRGTIPHLSAAAARQSLAVGSLIPALSHVVLRHLHPHHQTQPRPIQYPTTLSQTPLYGCSNMNGMLPLLIDILPSPCAAEVAVGNPPVVSAAASVLSLP